MEQYFWAKSVEQIQTELQTSIQGLNSSEAELRLSKYGKNELRTEERAVALKILLKQFASPLIIALIAISIVSFFTNDQIDALVIGFMLLFNAAIGFAQELKAHKSLQKLKSYISFQSKVKRDGKMLEIDSKFLVPGDIVLLNLGDRVSADIVLFEVNNLTVDESTLTGESLPIEKDIKPSSGTGPQDVKNAVFMGTLVQSGSAKGIVVATGRQTFLGSAVKSTEVVMPTKFESDLGKFTNILMLGVTIFTAFNFVINLLFLHTPIFTALLFSITLALGITPEVFPIIISIAISGAAHRLSKKHIIVKKLTAIESLGNMNVLCTDKTGTITEGKLTLVDWVNAKGERSEDILNYALICNSYNPSVDGRILTNSIDKTIWETAESKPLTKQLEKYKVTEVEEFNFEAKKMGVHVAEDNEDLFIEKGAYEQIVLDCEDADKKALDKILEENEGKGYKVLALSINHGKGKREFAGFLVFTDLLRKDTKQTFAQLRDLNIELKIISGDSPLVTEEICRQAGLEINGGKAIVGVDLEKLGGADFDRAILESNVFARITPALKARIINHLRESGKVVGYIGDGVNDVAAIKSADVGICVNNAVDVAKDSADLIMLESGLNVLANGALEGRKTFANTIKFIMNTMSSSFGNVIVMAIFPLVYKFLPLLPNQVLALDTISDGQHLATSTDNVDDVFLKGPNTWDLDRFYKYMIYFGAISCITDLIFIIVMLNYHHDIANFRTSWFLLSIFAEIMATFSIRTYKPIFASTPSRLLVITSVIVCLVTIVIAVVPTLQSIFGFVNIGIDSILIIAAGLIINLFIMEESKKRYFNSMKQFTS
jgi:Mg2+-importing ATPase